jgi:hypothetical protein
MAETTDELVYAEAASAMAQQRQVLESFRARAGALLTSTSLVTAFLGGLALTRSPSGELPTLDAWAWSGTVVFLASVAIAAGILVPWRWLFVFDAQILVRDHLDGESVTPVADLRRFLALVSARNYKSNERKLRLMGWIFAAGCACVAFEAVAWLMVITA